MTNIIKITIIIIALALGINVICDAIPVSNYNKNINIVDDMSTNIESLNLTDEQYSDIMIFYNILDNNIKYSMNEHNSSIRSRMIENSVDMNIANAKLILTNNQYKEYINILNNILHHNHIKISKQLKY